MSDATGLKEIPHITAVRTALRALSHTRGGSSLPTVTRLREFRDPSNEGQTIRLPCDIDRPPRRNDVGSYIMKEMEYVQTFLVADRLKSDVETDTPLLPRGYDPTPQIECILSVIAEKDGSPRYLPFPHLKAGDVRAPFVDFAGFVVVLMTDYVRWAAKTSDPIVEAAKAAAERAARFLLSEDTYIEHEGTVGWAFVANSLCDATPARPLQQCRHVFPTARALVALQRYAKSYQPSDELVAQATKLVPKSLAWLESLNRRKGEDDLFYASDVNEDTYLADHMFATEALLAIHELRSDDGDGLTVRKIAADAVRRLDINVTNDDRSVQELDRTIQHRLSIKDSGHSEVIDAPYDNRATIATCLATLAQGVDVLTGEDYKELKSDVRATCKRLAHTLLNDRRNPEGTWPRDFLWFHWTLGSVEALLRYSRFVPVKPLMTSAEQIEQAADMLLRDDRFVELFRKLLVEKIHEQGRPDTSE